MHTFNTINHSPLLYLDPHTSRNLSYCASLANNKQQTLRHTSQEWHDCRSVQGREIFVENSYSGTIYVMNQCNVSKGKSFQEEKYTQSKRQMGKKRQERGIWMQPVQTLLKLIHCLCNSLFRVFFRSEAESPPCPRCPWRRMRLQIFRCFQ